MLLTPRAKLLCIGDSITDCDRARPVGEGLFQASGKGWVAMVDSLLMAGDPARQVRVVNVGTGGNTVRDLEKRWASDVLDQKPDWLAVMIGANDVWRQFDCPHQPEWGVPLAEYEATLTRLVARTRATVQGLVLMTPFYIESNPDDAMRATMDCYGAVVKRLAQAHAAVCVDTQAAFSRVLAHYHANAFSWDRVHPNQAGHMVIAKAFLAAVGFAG